MDNSNLEEKSNIEVKEESRFIQLKSYEGINESNLMTIPFVSLRRSRVDVIENTWTKSNGDEVGIKVVGGAESGCPTMAEMDVLLALLRIMIKDNDNGYEYNKTDKKVKLKKTIHFTFKELARELGYADINGGIKKRLDKSIRILNETTIYSNFAIRDIEIGEYVSDFKGTQSCKILTNYKSYSMSTRKKQNKKLADYKTIREETSIDIDDFFFNNMCNNYFKIYNFKKYISLGKGISKKLFLILSQWSHGYEKYVTYKVLYNYIGIASEVNTQDKEWYYNRLIKDALDELVSIKFINTYEIVTSEGVNFIFNKRKLEKAKFKDRYLTFDDIYNRLREIGFDLDDVVKYVRLDNGSYISGLLRYIDDKINKGHDIKDLKNYVEQGLKYENYDIREYEI